MPSSSKSKCAASIEEFVYGHKCSSDARVWGFPAYSGTFSNLLGEIRHARFVGGIFTAKTRINILKEKFREAIFLINQMLPCINIFRENDPKMGGIWNKVEGKFTSHLATLVVDILLNLKQHPLIPV